MRIQWPAMIFWVALAAAVAAGFAYWNSRPVAPPPSVLGHLEDTTQGVAGPYEPDESIPPLSPSGYPLPRGSKPVELPPAPVRHKVVHHYHRRHVYRRPYRGPMDIRSRAQRSGFCASVPSVAAQFSREELINFMTQRGLSSATQAQVLACLGK